MGVYNGIKVFMIGLWQSCHKHVYNQPCVQIKMEEVQQFHRWVWRQIGTFYALR